MTLLGRNLLTIFDLSSSEVMYLLDLAVRLKQMKKQGEVTDCLKGRNVALIFEKTSTRTRCAFEIAVSDLGGNAMYLGPGDTQLGHKESFKDSARVFGRMFDAIEYRGFDHSRIETLARYSGIPVWNGLTDQYHPTQFLADLMTIREHCKKPLEQVSIAYLGDARNNVANSLLEGAALMGMDIRMVGPEQLHTDTEILNRCLAVARKTGARISIGTDIEKGVTGADFLYTDVWVSMGEPEEVWKERIEILRPYRVDARLMSLTGNKDVKFLHCLPAYHDRDTYVGEKIFLDYGLDGVEVTDEVFESEASIVFDQAENRLHTIKAVMAASLGNM